MKVRLGILVILMLVITIWLDFVRAQRQPDDNGFLGKYSVIVERNIFTRDRGKRKEPDSAQEQKQAAPAAGKSYILRGITLWGREYIAFFENSRYGATQMYRIGDPVEDVKIKNITLDHVEVENETQVVTIKIGDDLTGETASSPLTLNELIYRLEEIKPSAPTDENSGAQGAEPAKTEPEDTDDILKKLMERRNNELQ